MDAQQNDQLSIADNHETAELRNLADHSTQEDYSPALKELNPPLVDKAGFAAEHPYAKR